MGRHFTDNHRQNLSLACVDRIPWNKGKTKEQFPQLSRGGRSRGCITWNKGKTKEQFPQLANSGVKKGNVPSNKGRKGLQTAWNKGMHRTQETRDRISESVKIRWQDLDYANRVRRTVKNLWKNPEHAKKCLRRRIPSYPEKMFMDLCKNFRYVGNGQLIIDGKNPDFVCVHNDHMLVEIWGNYFHKGQNPQDRIDFFKDRGYNCLVIWASELKQSSSVIAKVSNFVDAS